MYMWGQFNNMDKLKTGMDKQSRFEHDVIII